MRETPVTALAWTTAARDPWLAVAHAGGEVDILVYRGGRHDEPMPAATITIRHPSAALALVWDLRAPHVLITGASDQTVRCWDVTLRKHAHPDAEVPLVPFAGVGREEAQLETPDFQPLDTTADSTVAMASMEQAPASRVVAADAPAAAAVSDAAHPAAGTSVLSLRAGMHAAQAVLDTSAALELQRLPQSTGDAAAAPSGMSCHDQSAMTADSNGGSTGPMKPAHGLGSAVSDKSSQAESVVTSAPRPGDTEPNSVTDAAQASLSAQLTTDQLPQSSPSEPELVSRPVDLSEVAAIRGDAFRPAKSPMRTAASLSVGSTVDRLRQDDQELVPTPASSTHLAPTEDDDRREPAASAESAPAVSAGDGASASGLAGEGGRADAVGGASASSPMLARVEKPAHGAMSIPAYAGPAGHATIGHAESLDSHSLRLDVQS